MKHDQTSHARTIGERLLFLKQFLASPRYMGSVTPSSSYLVNTLFSLADVPSAREIVELGPGTGPFTAGLLTRMPADGRLMCVERDPDLADHLRSRFTDARLIVVTGDAQELAGLLPEHGFGARVPLIVSGLPFTSLPDAVRDAIMRAIVSSLDPQGDFLLYQYSYAMRARLRERFTRVESRWEVRNIPPAVCMRCNP
ncbi:MAG: rRNA adenine N-6-methyltransferase family protein [Chloroflexota bacterium]